jgi:hypothetical protein
VLPGLAAKWRGVGRACTGRLFESAAALLLAALLTSGCEQKPKIDYAPLEQAGFSSSTVDQLKKLKVTDAEIPQVAKLKQLGLSDETCLAMVSDARAHHHMFSSGDSASNLAAAGYSEQDILAMAQADQIDSISTDAITLKLIGLSPGTVHLIVDRRLQSQPTLSSASIGRLKNTGVTERQILEYINQGMTDDEAEKEAAAREAKRNHANTDFVRTRGRRR